MFIIRRFFSQTPLGMNYRNYLIREERSALLRQVKSKADFKRILGRNGIATPRTIEEIHDFSDMPLISSFPDEFVVKPNRGHGGRGIILLQRKQGHFVNPSGDTYTKKDIKRHLRRILDGDFSGYIASDIAIIEERLYPSEKLQFKNAYGLSDIRIWCFHFQPVMAMLRYPTFKSKGRANLAAGGIGIGLDVVSGRPTYIHFKSALVEPQPAELGIPSSFAMPRWTEMKDIAVACSRISELNITGVDLVLDSDDRVRVLEVNGRPGLEIQNINEASLARHLWRDEKVP